jgi:hypothetical protein
MEAYEVDLNRYMDNNEKIERALFELEYELYNDIDKLNTVVMKIQELTDLYELEKERLLRVASNYYDYDFSDEIRYLIEEL